MNAVQSFLSWYEQTDPAAPNDRQFLARLTKVRTQLHAAKQYAIAERIEDIVACGEKVVVFTCYQAGIDRHKKVWGDAAVTITGADSVEARQAAVDRFQDDPQIKVALCNIIAGGVGITLTAARHVLFQDLDWVPANHAQAEDPLLPPGADPNRDRRVFPRGELARRIHCRASFAKDGSDCGVRGRRNSRCVDSRGRPEH